MINLTFITNGLSFIDAPHRIIAWFNKWRHERAEKDLLVKTSFVDNYMFDLGYNQSYCLVIFLNCLLFSTIVPIIPVFASVYFYIKYLVDKNNLVFVYYEKYESGGKIRASVKFYMLFNLFLYLVVMASFFGLKFSDSYKWLGPLLVVAWVGLYFYFKNSIEPTFNSNIF